MNVIKNPIIGLFNDSFPPIMDGVAMTVQNSAYALYLKNQPVCVITPKTPNYSIVEPYPVYRYTSIPFLLHHPYRIGIKEVDLPFLNTIEKIPLGLVHAHCPFSSGQLALQIAKKRKIPFVATFHSKYRDDFERTFHNKGIVKFLVSKIVEFYDSADEVWIPQAAVEETIREYGFKGKVYVVENGNDLNVGADLDSFRLESRQFFNFQDEENILLYVGQHIWEKNTKMILEALALMKHTPFKMLFIGTGYAADDMKQMVVDMGLEQKVMFLGVVQDRESLKKYYAVADLFLFPSLYDNAPLVVREASACGTPSILVRNSTASEIIQENVNGFLVEPTAESLARKIQELLGLPERRKEAGYRASKTIGRSWESVTDEILSRYRWLMRPNT